MALALYTADLGTPALTDVGYVFKDRLLADIGARTENGVSELEPGLYGVTLNTAPADAELIYWDSISDPGAYAYGDPAPPASAEGGPGTGSMDGTGGGDPLLVAGRPSMEILALPTEPGSPNADSRITARPDGSFAVELWRQDASLPVPDIKFALSATGKRLALLEGDQENVMRVLQGAQAIYYLVVIGPVLRLPVGTYEVHAAVDGRDVPSSWVTVRDSPFASGTNSSFGDMSGATITNPGYLAHFGLTHLLDPAPLPSGTRLVRRPANFSDQSLYALQGTPNADARTVAHPDGSFALELHRQGQGAPEPSISYALTSPGKKLSLLDSNQLRVFKTLASDGTGDEIYHLIVDNARVGLVVGTYAVDITVNGRKAPKRYVTVGDSPFVKGGNSGYTPAVSNSSWALIGQKPIAGGTTVVTIVYQSYMVQTPGFVAAALYDSSGQPVTGYALNITSKTAEGFTIDFEPDLPQGQNYTLHWAAWV